MFSYVLDMLETRHLNGSVLAVCATRVVVTPQPPDLTRYERPAGVCRLTTCYESHVVLFSNEVLIDEYG